MKRSRIAIIGLGRLGRACAQVVEDYDDLELVGIVRPGEHIRDLPTPDVVLVCVPCSAVFETAAGLLQQGFALVECAALEGHALEAHHAGLMHLAARHRSRAMVGAGWDPGVLTLLRRAFEMLIPHGVNEITRRPAVQLHHTVEEIPGVRAALAAEQRVDGGRQRYVYVELDPDTPLDAVRTAVAADPAFAGEQTQVFAVDSIAAFEAEGRGILLERRGSQNNGPHPALLLEGRFDPARFAARAMVDAARRLPTLPAGGHRYHLAL